jgi:hypothetical protein
MKAILTLTAIGLAAALLGLARELGLGITAPLVPALIVLVPDWLPLSHEVTTDLKLFTAEGVGRMACFCAVLVGIYALRGPDRWMPAIVAGALMALAGLTHLVPTLVAGAVLVLYAIAFVIVDRPRLRPSLLRGVVALLAFVVCYVGILGLSGGDLGLQRATSNAGFAGLPANVDPTLSFAHGAYVDKQPVHGHFFISPRDIVARYSEETIDKPTYGTVGLGFLALLGIGTVVALWLRRELFLICAVAWGLVAIILAVTFFFSYRYDTLIPANFGVRRLYDYVIIPPALLLPAIVEAIAGARRRCGDRSRAERQDARARGSREAGHGEGRRPCPLRSADAREHSHGRDLGGLDRARRHHRGHVAVPAAGGDGADPPDPHRRERLLQGSAGEPGLPRQGAGAVPRHGLAGNLVRLGRDGERSSSRRRGEGRCASGRHAGLPRPACVDLRGRAE